QAISVALAMSETMRGIRALYQRRAERRQPPGLSKPQPELGRVELAREVVAGEGEGGSEAEVDLVAEVDAQAGAGADVGDAAGSLRGTESGIGEGAILERPGAEFRDTDERDGVVLPERSVQARVRVEDRARVFLVAADRYPLRELVLKEGFRSEPDARE